MSRTGLTARRRSLLYVASAVLVLVAGAALVIHQLDRQTRQASKNALRDPLRVGIERDGFSTLVLQRATRETPWRIVAPCPLAITAARLMPLLGALNSVSARYPAGDVDLVGAGLSEPLATVVLDGERLEIGGPDLGGERRYLRAGDTVELVPEWILSMVQGGMTALATPALFARDVSAISTAAGASLTTDIDAWATLEATQIVDWPLADAPLIQTREQLVVRLDDGSEQAFELLRTDRFDALIDSDGGCARLLAPDTLPPFTVQEG